MTTTENTIDSGVSPFNPTQRQRLREESLKMRTFVDTPTSFIPYARCVRPRDQSPIYLKGLA